MQLVDVMNSKPSFSAELGVPEAFEVGRFGKLGDVALARELMAACRSARSVHAARMPRSGPLYDTATTAFFFDIVPEIVDRLGLIGKLEAEGRPDIEETDDVELADYLVNIAEMVPSSPSVEADATDPWVVLRAGAVEIAMNRLVLRASFPACGGLALAS